MANTIKIKNSGTASAVPSSLEYGELGLNYADGKLYYKNLSNTIVQLSGPGSGTLDGLSDVTVPSPTSGDILSYNGSAWVNIANFAEATKHYVKNDTGASLSIGSVVYTSGANGTNMLVKKAQANAETTSATVLGIMSETLAINGIGFVVTQGLVSGFDTSTATAGDPVWLSPTTAGGVLYGVANKPSAPNHLVYLGTVTRAQSQNGEIFVNISNGWELEELHNVSAGSPSSGDFLKYNGSAWINDAIDLGTDTNGSYVASLVAGTGISLANNIGEGATPTITNSGVTAITGTANQISASSSTGSITLSMPSSIVVANNITANENLVSNFSSGPEGGEIHLATPQTDTTLSGPIKIDVYANRIRFFEGGGSARGAYIDLTAAGSGASTNLLGTSGAMNYEQQQSGKVSNVSSNNATIVSRTFTTNGYPVQVMVTGDAENSAAGGWIRVQLFRDSTAIGKGINIESSAGSENVPYALTVIDTPSAGTYTYALKTVTAAASGSFNFGEVDGPVLTMIELAGRTGATGPAGNISSSVINDLSDVTVPSPSTGDFLKYNGSAWVNDAIDLSTDTTGSYVSSLVAGTGITLANNSGEAATPTISIGQAVGTTSNVTFGSVVAGNVGQNGSILNINGSDIYINTGTNLGDDNGTVTIGGSLSVTSAINGVLTVGTQAIIFEGVTQDSYQTTIEAVDPTADRTITFPDASGTVELSEVLFNQQTSTYTLTLADKSKMVEMNVGTANNLTVPADNIVNFPVGTSIDILQVGSGQTTIVAAAGVTINRATGLKLRAQWSAATLVKRAANTWVAVGDLSA